jgi:hypothetical protein
MKKLILLPLIFIYYLGFCQGDKISITDASRYQITLKNNTNFTLKYSFYKKGKHQISNHRLPPQNGQSITSNFTKRTLHSSKIYINYDENCYLTDFNLATEKHQIALNNIRNSRAYKEKNIETEFRTRLLCAVNSSDKSGNIVEWLANRCQFYYNAKDTYNYFTNKSYNNIGSFLKDLAKYNIDGAIIERVSEELRDKIGTNKTANQNVIKSCLFYIQGMSDIPQNIENERLQEIANYNNYIKMISDMRYDEAYNQSYIVANNFPSNSNFASITPSFQIHYEPLIFGGNLNEYWEAGPRGIKSRFATSSDTYSYKYFSYGVKLSIPISPEISISNSIKSRLYLTPGYYVYKYNLADIGFSLSNTLFNNIPTPAQKFDIEFPLGYNQTTIMGGLQYKIQLKRKVSFDVGGGLIQQTGQLDFRNSTLSSGFSWAFETLNVTNPSINPFRTISFGYYYTPNINFTISLSSFKSSAITNSDRYFIEDSAGKIVDYSNDSWISKVQVGVIMAF